VEPSEGCARGASLDPLDHAAQAARAALSWSQSLVHSWTQVSTASTSTRVLTLAYVQQQYSEPGTTDSTSSTRHQLATVTGRRRSGLHA
jgi:hypothetical protein